MQEAQQYDKAVNGQLIEPTHAVPDVSCCEAVDGEVWEVSRFGGVLLVTETGEGRGIQVYESGEATRAQFDTVLAGLPRAVHPAAGRNRTRSLTAEPWGFVIGRHRPDRVPKRRQALSRCDRV